MKRTQTRAWLCGLGAAATAAALTWTAAAQDSKEAPRLPVAVTKAPAELVEGAPFDVAKFFEAPPEGENAAPLYLDALFEFGGEMAACFPESPAREARLEAEHARGRRFFALDQALQKDPKGPTNDEIDAVIALYDEGFRKLKAAQERPRCVFEAGVGVATLIPHAQGARQVARVARLRVRRALDRGDFAAAIDDVKACLRLSRDLRPRGYLIMQLVSAAVDGVTAVQMARPILEAPGLKPEHCDALIGLLAEHEARSADPYAEGLKAEYLTNRLLINDLARNRAKLAKELGLKDGESPLASLTNAMSMLAPAGATKGRDGAAPPAVASRPDPAKLEERIARATPEELARQADRLAAYYKALLDLKGEPVAAQIARTSEASKALIGDDPFSQVLEMIRPAVDAFVLTLGRDRASTRAHQCLAALKRWELAHGEPAPSLADAARESKLKEIPIDPYDGKPMRMVVVDGKPRVYSVGKDGKDDGGLVDSFFDSRPGDLIFPQPKR